MKELHWKDGLIFAIISIPCKPRTQNESRRRIFSTVEGEKINVVESQSENFCVKKCQAKNVLCLAVIAPTRFFPDIWKTFLINPSKASINFICPLICTYVNWFFSLSLPSSCVCRRRRNNEARCVKSKLLHFLSVPAFISTLSITFIYNPNAILNPRDFAFISTKYCRL